MAIDAHQHFWRYNPRDYPWLDHRMSGLRHDYRPALLQCELAATGIAGSVAVQARQTIEETDWLLALAARHHFIKGVVGWVPLASLDPMMLELLAADAKLKGVRHVVQDEPDPDFILRPDFNRGVARLRQWSLTYDILIFERQLPQAIKFVDRHPNQLFILDHLAKPRILDGDFKAWARLLRTLAERPHVYAKVSGLVTESDWVTWSDIQLRRYFDVALEAFGPKRIMFGSDWPVCLVATGYSQWHGLVKHWISALTLEEQARILGGTAAEIYRL